jgi:hypothetical protein
MAKLAVISLKTNSVHLTCLIRERAFVGVSVGGRLPQAMIVG